MSFPDLTTEPQDELDPAPSLFGTAALAPGELERAMRYLENRAARFAFGARLQAMLVGNPIAGANVRAAYQPLRDVANDLSMPVADLDEDDVYGSPITNWGANR